MIFQKEESHGEINNLYWYNQILERLYEKSVPLIYLIFVIYKTDTGLRRKHKMKVRPSVKKICEKCKIIRRNGVVRVICENPKHKQRQG